jgi:hypothetical protein
MRLRGILVVALIACGKRSSPPPPPVPVQHGPPPPVIPDGVVGCIDSYLAIPNESRTDFVIVQVDHTKFGSHVKLPLQGDVNGLNVTLDVFERPVDGREAYCTDYGTNEERAERYVAVEGRIEVIRKGNLVSATITDARFVDARGRIVDIARRECANVKVGWSPG